MLARRYAKALLELSIKEGSTGTVRNDMEKLGKLVKQKKYNDFFTNRLVRPADKLEPLNGLTPLSRDLVRLVVENKREALLYLITNEFTGLYDRMNNIIDVEVASRDELTVDQKKQLGKMLERSLKRKIRFTFAVNKKIGGGMILKYGDMVMDGTVSGMLEEISSLMKDG